MIKEIGLLQMQTFNKVYYVAAISALENYDTNGCTDFTDCTDSYGFFENECLILGKKKSV
jgi:hypothetical protein